MISLTTYAEHSNRRVITQKRYFETQFHTVFLYFQVKEVLITLRNDYTSTVLGSPVPQLLKEVMKPDHFIRKLLKDTLTSFYSKFLNLQEIPLENTLPILPSCLQYPDFPVGNNFIFPDAGFSLESISRII